jgi:predicted nucleic acid-binding protein
VTTRNDSESVLVDSSGWLEYITGDSKADLFMPYFEGELLLLVPTIVLYEVRKVLLLRQRRSEADLFLSQALRSSILPLDEVIALSAANLSLQHRLSMADAVIYATAQVHQAEIVTSDAHFSGLAGVTLI